MPSLRRPASPRTWLVAVTLAVAGLAPVVSPALSPVALAAPSASRPVIDGPDVASYQHPRGARIAWRKVARAHHEFAIVKASEGTYYRNPWFHADYSGAHNAGLVRGSYHFARPAYPIVATARHQARYYASMLGSSATTRRTLPPALDLEMTGGLGRGALVTWAQTFLLQVRRLTGRTPMIYTYPSFWTGPLGDPVALARYPLWMASYSGGVDPNATLWQYTSRATVRGIAGAVDMSRFMAGPQTWASISDGRTPTPWPAAAPGAPQQVQVGGGDSRATLSWMPGDTGSSDITGYRVTAVPADGSDPTGTSVSVGATTWSATVPGLTNGTAYDVSVLAVNSQGDGVSSQSLEVVPMVPTVLKVATPPNITTYGDDATVRVQLLRPDRSRPLSGRAVTVEQADPVTGAWTPWQTLTTSDTGWVRVHFTQPQHSLQLRFAFTGPTGWHKARVVVPVVVHNGVTARLSRTRVRAGHPVTMSGRITPAVGGITVTREGYYGHRWHVWSRTTTQEDGSYSFVFSPTAKTTDIYRVVVAHFDGRASGNSATMTLKVH